MDLFRKTPCVSVMGDQRGAWLVGRGCIEESGAQVQTAEVKCQTATGGGTVNLTWPESILRCPIDDVQTRRELSKLRSGGVVAMVAG